MGFTLKNFPLGVSHHYFGSWYTSEQDNGLIDLHLTFGYVALGLITFRVLWGFWGTKHSQFKNFVPTPYRLISYLKKEVRSQTTHSAGHNPAGSLMVVFMLTLILLQAISGLFMNDDIFTSGPYYGVVDGDIEAVLVYIHRNSFDFILAAIALHILAIMFYKKVKKKSLVLPMITGKKSSEDVPEKDAIKHSKIVMALIIALAVAAFIYWLVVINAPVVEEYYY